MSLSISTLSHKSLYSLVLVFILLPLFLTLHLLLCFLPTSNVWKWLMIVEVVCPPSSFNLGYLVSLVSMQYPSHSFP